MLDAESGFKAGLTLSGQAHQIDIRSQVAACRPGRSYVHIHTHPSSGAFSDADVRVLLTNRELLAIVAVGLDGRWYVMSRSVGVTSPDPWEATDQFVLEFRRLLDDALMPLAELPHVV